MTPTAARDAMGRSAIVIGESLDFRIRGVIIAMDTNDEGTIVALIQGKDTLRNEYDSRYFDVLDIEYPGTPFPACGKPQTETRGDNS